MNKKFFIIGMIAMMLLLTGCEEESTPTLIVKKNIVNVFEDSCPLQSFCYSFGANDTNQEWTFEFEDFSTPDVEFNVSVTY